MMIDRLIRNPEAEWEDVMVMPTHIVTRQSTDIYANNDPHIAEVLRYLARFLAFGYVALVWSRVCEKSVCGGNPL